jgi:hypothetical protein
MKQNTSTEKPVRVSQCVCKHEAQDELHGAGNRVKNPCKSAGGGAAYRCTVCGRIEGS